MLSAIRKAFTTNANANANTNTTTATTTTRAAQHVQPRRTEGALLSCGDAVQVACDRVASLLAVGTTHGAVHVFGSPGLTQSLVSDTAMGSRVTAMAFPPGTGTLVVGHADGRLVVWDIGMQLAVGTLRVPDSSAVSLACPPGSPWVFVGTRDGALRVFLPGEGAWSTYAVPATDVAGADAGPLVTVAVHPLDANTLLLVYHSGACALWDLEKRRATVFRHPDGRRATHGVWRRDGKYVCTASHDGMVYKWLVKSPGAPKQAFRAHDGPVLRLHWSAPTRQSYDDTLFLLLDAQGVAAWPFFSKRGAGAAVHLTPNLAGDPGLVPLAMAVVSGTVWPHAPEQVRAVVVVGAGISPPTVLVDFAEAGAKPDARLEATMALGAIPFLSVGQACVTATAVARAPRAWLDALFCGSAAAGEAQGLANDWPLCGGRVVACDEVSEEARVLVTGHATGEVCVWDVTSKVPVRVASVALAMACDVMPQDPGVRAVTVDVARRRIWAVCASGEAMLLALGGHGETGAQYSCGALEGLDAAAGDTALVFSLEQDTLAAMAGLQVQCVVFAGPDAAVAVDGHRWLLAGAHTVAAVDADACTGAADCVFPAGAVLRTPVPSAVTVVAGGQLLDARVGMVGSQDGHVRFGDVDLVPVHHASPVVAVMVDAERLVVVCELEIRAYEVGGWEAPVVCKEVTSCVVGHACVAREPVSGEPALLLLSRGGTLLVLSPAELEVVHRADLGCLLAARPESAQWAAACVSADGQVWVPTDAGVERIAVFARDQEPTGGVVMYEAGCALPEAPKEGFFSSLSSSLFGGSKRRTPSDLLGVLGHPAAGGAAPQTDGGASERDASERDASERDASERDALLGAEAGADADADVGGVQAVMEENVRKLEERGDTLRTIDQKTLEMADESKQMEEAVAQWNQEQRKRKWYQL